MSRPTASTSRSEVAKLVPGERLSRRRREVGRQAPGVRDRAVEPAQDPEQEPKREEREREDQQRRRQEHQGVELVPGARRLHRRPSELDEGEQRDREHEQLHGHARDQRAVLAREQPPFLQDRPSDVRQRQQEQRDRTDERPDRAEHEREVDRPIGNSTPGRDGPFAFEASLARAMPSSRPRGYATIAVNRAWMPCAASSLPRENPRLRGRRARTTVSTAPASRRPRASRA